MDKKADNKNKIIIALAILTIVIVLVGVWAFARYTSTVSGSGTAAVAAWSFKANEGTSTMTNISLVDVMNTVNGKVAPNHMAPGTSGSFDIDIDASGSEVAVSYSIVLDNFANLPQNLHFYTDSAHQNEITIDSGAFTASGYIPYNATPANMQKTTTIYWAWPYQSGVEAEEIAQNDAQDTLDSGKDITFDITVTGWQSNPGSAVAE